MKMYDSAIFDLDGTILDTLDDLKDSVNFALCENGLPARSREEVRRFVGNGIRLLVERAVPQSTPVDVVDKCFDAFKKHYKDNSANSTKPYEHITDVLCKLKAEGIALAVVSNKADFAVQTLVEEYFPGIFHFVVGEREGIKRKPCADSVFAAMEALGSKNAIYIGDSEVDVETAVNSGLDCLAVTWGFRGENVLKELNPKYIVNEPEEIIDIILK